MKKRVLKARRGLIEAQTEETNTNSVVKEKVSKRGLKRANKKVDK